MATALPRSSSGVMRRSFIEGLILGYFALLTLLGYTFLQYPDAGNSLGTGPKASVPAWLGTQGADIAYWLLGALFASLYVWVAVRGTRSTRPTIAQPWQSGALIGLLAGLLGFGASWLADATHAGTLGGIGWLFAVVALVGAGALGARQTGRVATGALAGFWCGLVVALLFALQTIALDNLFVATLVRTLWAHDSHCPLRAAQALAACEISDDLGFVATLMVALPLVGAGLGALGGAVGVGLAQRQPPAAQPARAAREDAARAPIIFSGVMLGLFVVELLGHLW